MRQEIQEGKANVLVDSADVISKGLEVFYNPEMKFNRDGALEILKACFSEPVRIADPMAGSGVRAIRMLLEVPIKQILLNDLNPKARELIAVNLERNAALILAFQGRPWNEIVEIHGEDANVFLRKNGHFDYIDIDPYGSSIYFVDSAISAISRTGVIACTNTDTAALCGSYPKVALRRYGSVPYNCSIRQQFGLRILAKKVQEIGAIYDRALIPIFSFSKDH